MSLAYSQSMLRYSGSAEGGYRSWSAGDLQTGLRSSDGNEYLQNYRFKLSGTLFSPNFLVYSYGTRFSQSDRTFSYTDIRERSIDLYDIDTRFFQNRPVWFSVFTKRTRNDLNYSHYNERKYDNLSGTNIYVMVPELPRIQLGYQYNSTESDKAGNSYLHISTINLQRAGENSSVSAGFRDEQRKTNYQSGIARTQQFILNGKADLFERTTSIMTDIDYTQTNAFENGRFSVRLLRYMRETDRLMILYGYNSYQSPVSQSSSNSIEGDYKRVIDSDWTYVLRTTMFRHILRSGVASTIDNIKFASSGLEYLNIKSDSIDIFRNSGNVYIDVTQASTQMNRGLVRTNRTYEKKHKFSDLLNWSNRYSASVRYERLEDINRGFIENQFINQIQFLPYDPLLIQNQTTVKDMEGSTKDRSIESRGDIYLNVARHLQVQSGLIATQQWDPVFNQTYTWTNGFSYEFLRNLVWTGLSSKMYNRSNGSENTRLESGLDYRLRETKISARAEYRKEFGLENTTIYLNASRAFGN